MRPEAWVVSDLGFGDAGKGTITDWLVRERGAQLVVRWNGGAQAGHNVVAPDGRHHCFSQLGAGTFVPGVRTHLSEAMVLHPTALRVEAERLARIGVGDALERLTVAESALVTTPFHQAAGRLRELARASARHGTCGVGAGETVRDALDAPAEAIRAAHLRDRRALRARTESARERLAVHLGDTLAEMADHPIGREEAALLMNRDVIDRWIDAIGGIAWSRTVVADGALGGLLRGGSVVLEGAQGILLDEQHGFHPHTTWSDCTSAAAVCLLARHGFDAPVRRLGVMRAYLTRHGEGPFPTEAPELDALLPEAHNDGAGWQGAFRRGFPDRWLWRYALAVSGGVDGLAITHVDRIDALAQWKLSVGYAGDLPASADPAELARALFTAEPVYESVSRHGLLERMARELERPIWALSCGATAADKRWHDFFETAER